MTKDEWLSIGYEKNIIDLDSYEEIPFYVMYRQWFVMKMKLVKERTVDRIDDTFRSYYSSDSIIEMCISKIGEKEICDFLTAVFTRDPKLNYKDFLRIYQIINNVMVYARDIRAGGARLIDWDYVKRNSKIPKNEGVSKMDSEKAVSDDDVKKLIDSVVNHSIYPEDSKCAALCICMNFYLGLRVGELSALTFDCFDFKRGVVKIFRTETKFRERLEDGSRSGAMVYRVVDSCKTISSVREIPLMPEVVSLYNKIRDYHSHRGFDSPYLAYDGRDCVLYNSLERTLRNLCILCDVPIFNFHRIRKTFGTKLHFANVPTKIVSDLLGHADVSTTERFYLLNYDDNYYELLNYMKGGLNYYDAV